MFFPLPLTPLSPFLTVLLLIDTEKSNLLLVCFVNTLLPLELGKGPSSGPLMARLPHPSPHRARSPQGQARSSPGACGTLFRHSGYWISLPQSPKLASRVCLGLFMGISIEDR